MKFKCVGGGDKSSRVTLTAKKGDYDEEFVIGILHQLAKTHPHARFEVSESVRDPAGGRASISFVMTTGAT